ncbi:anti-sigma factor [Actinophytocola oryzae]|uniref:Regulator of SigK n=1 Tax=Actinophytocola oryzae TaxID=502181 RepID=A0A4R7UQJ1_9PSEU|nr:anti-sigma factor [Actinophytocola oryzae]TDV35288.1 putative zinc finger protein [Actinophytocola oryzae]
MTVDLHTLTGAYVLHATSDTERAAFERHLTDCGSCTVEVRELGETAVRLGLATVAVPPPHLKQTVLVRIRTERQARVLRRRVPSPGPRLVRRLVAGTAAAMVVASGTLGVALVVRSHDVDQAQHRTEVLATVLRARDVRFVHSGGITVVVARGQDRGVLLADLPQAPDGHVYQAWTVDSGYHAAGAPFEGSTTTELTGLVTANRVAVTVEPISGSTQPTTAPVVETAIP